MQFQKSAADRRRPGAGKGRAVERRYATGKMGFGVPAGRWATGRQGDGIYAGQNDETEAVDASLKRDILRLPPLRSKKWPEIQALALYSASASYFRRLRRGRPRCGPPEDG